MRRLTGEAAPHAFGLPSNDTADILKAVETREVDRERRRVRLSVEEHQSASARRTARPRTAARPRGPGCAGQSSPNHPKGNTGPRRGGSKATRLTLLTYRPPLMSSGTTSRAKPVSVSSEPLSLYASSTCLASKPGSNSPQATTTS